MFTRNEIKDACALTAMQQGILHHALLHEGKGGGAGNYHLQIIARFDGPLDADTLRRAWQTVVDRHDALRGRFVHERVPRPVHLIPHRENLVLPVVAIAAPSGSDELPEAVKRALADDAGRPFDLSNEHPMRLALYSAAHDRHWLMWSTHHILLDGWSLGVVLDEVLQAYRQMAAGRTAELPAVCPYGRYQGWLIRRDRDTALAHWRHALTGFDGAGILPPAALSRTAGQARVLIGAEQASGLKTLAARHRSTVHHLLGAAWALVIGRLSGREDLVVYTVVAGRPPEIAGIEKLPGLLMNTVPVRVRWSPGQSFAGVLDRVRDALVSSGPHQHVSLADIQAAVGALAQDNLLLMQDLPYDQAVGPVTGDVSLAQVEFREQPTFPLEIAATPRVGAIELVLRSRHPDLQAARLRALADALERVLAQVLRAPDSALAALDFFKEPPADIFPRVTAPSAGPQPVRREVAGGGLPASGDARLIAEAFAEVLGTPVGVTDDFFVAGGHSLSAMRAIGTINRKLDSAYRLRDLYLAPTASALAARRHLAAVPAIARAAEAPDYPLSYGQQALWVLDQMNPGYAGYNVPGAYRIRGVFDIAAFHRAWAMVVRRHEALRTTFEVVRGEPRQRIHADMSFMIETSDLSNGVGQAEEIVAAITNRPFDLAKGPLFRIAALRIAEDDHILVMVLHHIISDGWSDAVLVGDLAAAWQGRELPPSPPVRYCDFAVWQTKLLASNEAARHADYWRHRLAGAAPLQLPVDRPRRAQASRSGRRAALMLARDDGAEWLVRVGAERRAASFAAAAVALLYQESGQTDIVLGMPVAGRERPELQEQVGFHLNLLPVRLRFAGSTTLAELVDAAAKAITEALSHADYPFARLVEDLGLSAAPGRHPIFDAMLIFHQRPTPVLSLEGLTVELPAGRSYTSRYDLDFEIWAAPDLHGYIEYDSGLFDEARIVALAERWRDVLMDIAFRPDTALASLSHARGRTRQAERAAFIAQSLNLDTSF